MTSDGSRPEAIPSPEVWDGVPQQNRNFTGREEMLQELRERVTTRPTALVPMAQALYGLGGVGKTQLAAEYAYRYAGEYDLVWWIQAEQSAYARARIAALAPRLNLADIAQGRIEDAVNAVFDRLRRGVPYRRWLLIFDNADQPEQIRRLIPDGPGDVIITSRDRNWADALDALEVDVFSRDESRKFLGKRIHGIAGHQADSLAEEFGDLPLGLEQAAACIAQTAMTVEVYIDLLREANSRILAEGPTPRDYPVPVAAAWTLSVNQLRTQSPDAMELLQFCAFLGATAIPLDLLARGRFALSSSLKSTLNDPIFRGRAIRALGRYALARIDNIRQTIEVHRIIQRVIRDDLDPDTQSKIRHEVHMLLSAADQAIRMTRKAGRSTPSFSVTWALPRSSNAATTNPLYAP